MIGLGARKQESGGGRVEPGVWASARFSEYGTFIEILHEKPRMALRCVRRAMGQLNEGETGGKNETAA
jgi:hypothetical protein